eukprot:scaffold36747_cov46-Attheya_sp.AAC.1
MAVIRRLLWDFPIRIRQNLKSFWKRSRIITAANPSKIQGTTYSRVLHSKEHRAKKRNSHPGTPIL